MIAHRNVQSVAAAIVASALVGWFSGCGNDADGQFREYSQLEPASVAVEADGTDNRSDGENNPRNVTPASVETVAVTNTQASVIAQSPIEAPLPASFADSDNESGSASGSESPAIDRTTDPSPIGSGRQKPIVDGGTRNPSGDAGKTSIPAVPRQVKILVKQRKFKVEGPDEAIRVSYDDIDLLKVLNMEPVTADAPKRMPVWLKGLDGRRIRIRGFMYPSFQETGIPAFLMARDNQICCFGGEAKIYDLFPVILRKGVTTDYILNRPFDVVGVFHIDTIVDEGELYQLYRIDDAVVIDK